MTRRVIRKWIWEVACLLAAGLVSNAAAQSPVEVSDRVRIRKSEVNGFVHPGIGLNKEMLEEVRAQVLAKREPWYAGFIKLASHPRSSKNVSSANRSKSDPTEPELTAFNNAAVEGRLKVDADVAMRQILMFWFTGDETYRSNAMSIVRLWAKMDPARFKAYNEVYIHCSFAFKDMIMAAELLRGMETPSRELAWTDEDTMTFSKNFVVPGVTNFFDHNGWFMNQNGFAYAPAIAGAIFRSDPQDFAKRVERFTVNKDGPDKGSSFSIKDLARLVDTDAVTGKEVVSPQVQITEMGRDQAHAGDDMTIFTTIARILNSQGTKVDPISGVPSKASDAVGPYEFLDDRILAAADHFCRFMLGYDTPWIPTPSHMSPEGEIRQVYPRIADNYRGRIRQHRMWDLHYHYTCKRGIDLAEKAPYYHETFLKRIVSDDYDWLYIPKEATGDTLRIPPSEQEPAVVEVELRSSPLGENASVENEPGVSFLRVDATPAGARVSVLSCATDQKTIGMRVRTTGVVEVEMSGFEKPWLIPDTRGEWRSVFHTMSSLERFGDIVFFNLKGMPGTVVDLDQLFRKTAEQTPVFSWGDASSDVVAHVGGSVQLDFSVKSPGKKKPFLYTSPDMPQGAVLEPQSGAFRWTPTETGNRVFVVEVSHRDIVTARKVVVSVVPDREAALETIRSAYHRETAYVTASAARCQALYTRASGALKTATETEFFQMLVELKEAFDALEPLTPLLADGGIDFPKIVTANIDKVSMSQLVDGNDDTFVGFYLAPDRLYDLDFGPDFTFAPTAFAMEGRVNFEDRIDGVKFHGSNDRTSWTELSSHPTGRHTELTRVEAAGGLENSTFRFLRVRKHSGGILEASEMRLFGHRLETGNKLEAVSLESDKQRGVRIALGDPVRLVIRTREPVQDVRVCIQDVKASVRQTGPLSYVAEAEMRPGKAKTGPVAFSIDYRRGDGTPAHTTAVTTDNSRLVLFDESELIADVPRAAKLIDPNTGAVAAHSARLLDSLFDDNPDTFTELNYKGSGAGAYLVFDFGPSRSVRISRVEVMARPKFRDRIAGAVVEGSNDGETWKPISGGALPTEDWQSLEMRDAGEAWRYLRIYNRNNWHSNLSEIRFHGEFK